MSGFWEGYWQVVYDSDAEEIVEFRNTTTAVRPALGFRLITVEDDRFVAVLPPYEDADEGWRRIG